MMGDPGGASAVAGRAASTAAAAAAAASPDPQAVLSVLDWLLSLRISTKDAGEYSAALVDLGFDDLQSLQEDATKEDLHEAGMKTGHVRRVFRALHPHPHPHPHHPNNHHHHHHHHPNERLMAPSSSMHMHAATAPPLLHRLLPDTSRDPDGGGASVHRNAEIAPDPHPPAPTASATAATSARGRDGSSIIRQAGSDCVVTCDDMNGRWQRFSLAPASGNEALAARRLDEKDGSEGAAVAGGKGSSRGAATRAWASSAASQQGRPAALFADSEFVSRRAVIKGSHSWPACAAPTQHAPVPGSRWRAASAGNVETEASAAAAAAAAISAVESARGLAIRSPIETTVVRSEGEQSPRKGRPVFHSTPKRQCQSMPIVKFQELSGLRICQGRGGSEGRGDGEDSSRCGSGGSSDLISEELDMAVSTGDSSGEDFLVDAAARRKSGSGTTTIAAARTPQASGNPAPAAAWFRDASGNPQGSSRSVTRRRVSVDLAARSAGAETRNSGNHHHVSPPLIRMSSLTGGTPRSGATATPSSTHTPTASTGGGGSARMVRVSSEGADLAVTRSLDTGTRASAPIRRPRLYSIDDGFPSTLSISTSPTAGATAASPTPTAATAAATGGSVSRMHQSRPGRPGRGEKAVARAYGSGPVGFGAVLGRSAHIKTLQRIRSTGRLGHNRMSNVGTPGDGGGGTGRGTGVASPDRSSQSQPRNGAVAVGAAATESGSPPAERPADAMGVPEDIDARLEYRREDAVVAAPVSSVGQSAVDGELPRGGGGGGGGSDKKEWPAGGGDGGGGYGGLSLELSILPEQSFGELEQSYDFSDGGTLQTHGFVFRPDGMKSTPTPNRAGTSEGRSLASRPSYEDKIRALRPPALQTTFGSAGRTPCSRDSSFGGAARGLGGGGGGGGGGLVPPLITTTPRRTRENTILLEEIGRGGGGTVYKAIHVPSMRQVAVKVVEVHDDERRRQLVKELKALLSMNRVPLTSPGRLATSDSAGGILGLRGWDESSFGSSEGASSGGSGGGVGADVGGGTWQDGDSPTCDPGVCDVEGNDGHYFSGTECGDPTRATATTATPSSAAGTLSSRDGTPSSQAQTRAQVCGAGAGDGGGASAGAAGGGSRVEQQGGLRPIHGRPASTCGFAPGSMGSGAGGGGRRVPGNMFWRPNADHQGWREGGNSGGGAGGSGSGSRPDPPVVALHDAYTDTERGRVCMVMEYMDGGTLQQFIDRHEALSEPALAAVARSVLRGLAEMHANHQIHRDIKPSNILLDRHGRVKISDFGVVRELNRTGSLAQTFTGTLTYMSPERIVESDYSTPSDVWGLGMVIAALALGRFPLSTAGGYFEMVQAITEDPVPKLSPQSFSAELCDFMELMLRREASERPSAAKLLKHPFLREHRDCHKLVGMVKVAPATSAEVQSLLMKVVDYHLAASTEERDERVSFFGKDSASGGGWSPQPTAPPSLRKADVEVLAAQLQVTRTELVEEYDQLRRRAERELWGYGLQTSSRNFRRGNGSAGSGGGGGGGGIAPITPGLFSGRGQRLRSVSSPQRLDLTTCPPRHACETPPTAGSAFSSATSRRRRREGGTPAGRSRTPRLSSPTCRSVSDTRQVGSSVTARSVG